jgi:acetylornithine deacetylase/succinyl-diaminopimelate desuccinylase-like protein
MHAFPEMPRFFELESDAVGTAAAIRRKAAELKIRLNPAASVDELEEEVRAALRRRVADMYEGGMHEDAQALAARIDDAVREAVSGTQRYVCRTFTGRVAADKTFNACANMHFQGACADSAKLALFGKWLRGDICIDFIHGKSPA